MQIKDVKHVNHAELKAYFTLVLDNGVQLRKLKLVLGKDGNPKINFPTDKYTKQDGTVDYYAYMVIPQELKTEIIDLACAEVFAGV